LDTDFNYLSDIQLENFNLLIRLIGKSERKNVAYLHSVNSYEELSKMDRINLNLFKALGNA